ncbi:MAG: hypothetical protein HY770_01095 [Chitinivibrionia bacterium]|nr:hypothetical protein [Chitinivibrionia bacterium]
MVQRKGILVFLGVCFLLSLLLLPWYGEAATITAVNNENGAGVMNGAPGGPSFTLSQVSELQLIRTYHWNNGRGAPLGQIWLQGGPNNLRYGPWQATAQATFWVVQPPRVVLPAGTYTVGDSDHATWSYNSQSGGKGFALVNVNTLTLASSGIEDQKGVVARLAVPDRPVVIDTLMDDTKGPVQAPFGLRPYPALTVDRPNIRVNETTTVRVQNPYPGWLYYLEIAPGTGGLRTESSGTNVLTVRGTGPGSFTVISQSKIGSVRSVPPTEWARITVNVQ